VQVRTLGWRAEIRIEVDNVASWRKLGDENIHARRNGSREETRLHIALLLSCLGICLCSHMVKRVTSIRLDSDEPRFRIFLGLGSNR